MPVEQIGKTTRLAAVNMMLRALGEVAVSTLTSPSRSDVSAAIDQLDVSSREVQLEGWWFNSETITLTPDNNSQIHLSDEYLEIDLWTYDPTEIATERDGKLYNLTKGTFTFPDEVKVNIIRQLPFESLPEAARKCITARASRILLDHRVGDPQLRQFAQQDEMTARYELECKENENGDYNVFKNGFLNQLINGDLR